MSTPLMLYYAGWSQGFWFHY